MILSWRDVPIGDGPPIPTSLTGDEATMLMALAADRSVLEVGSAYGYSAVVMAQTAEQVLAVDPHDERATPLSLERMRSSLAAYEAEDTVSILLGTSERVLPALHRLGCRFGLVFVDADHAQTAVQHDVRWATRLLAAHGVLAVHDFGESTCPGVARALDAEFPDGPDTLTDTLWVRQP